MNDNLIQLSYDAFQASQRLGNASINSARQIAGGSLGRMSYDAFQASQRLGNASSQLQPDESGQLLHKAFPAIHCVNWGKHH